MFHLQNMQLQYVSSAWDYCSRVNKNQKYDIMLLYIFVENEWAPGKVWKVKEQSWLVDSNGEISTKFVQYTNISVLWLCEFVAERHVTT